MTLKECYEVIGGDYEGVLGRLRSEALIRKFTIRFLDDKSVDALHQALEAGNGEDAFRAAHTIKGVCQNLGFTRLYETSEALTESLRSRELPADQGLVQALEETYEETVTAIRELAASAG